MSKEEWEAEAKRLMPSPSQLRSTRTGNLEQQTRRVHDARKVNGRDITKSDSENIPKRFATPSPPATQGQYAQTDVIPLLTAETTADVPDCIVIDMTQDDHQEPHKIQEVIDLTFSETPEDDKITISETIPARQSVDNFPKKERCTSQNRKSYAEEELRNCNQLPSHINHRTSSGQEASLCSQKGEAVPTSHATLNLDQLDMSSRQREIRSGKWSRRPKRRLRNGYMAHAEPMAVEGERAIAEQRRKLSLQNAKRQKAAYYGHWFENFLPSKRLLTTHGRHGAGRRHIRLQCFSRMGRCLARGQGRLLSRFGLVQNPTELHERE